MVSWKQSSCFELMWFSGRRGRCSSTLSSMTILFWFGVAVLFLETLWELFSYGENKHMFFKQSPRLKNEKITRYLIMKCFVFAVFSLFFSKKYSKILKSFLCIYTYLSFNNLYSKHGAQSQDPEAWMWAVCLLHNIVIHLKIF